MFSAAFSLVLLIEAGPSVVALVSVAVTCLLTTVSVLLFGRRSGAERERA
jgi:hypothetical protein